jgi:hypothetical protein
MNNVEARAPVNFRQVALITGVAIAAFVGFRLLPTGTNLSHMDFRATGANVIEFCDPLNPQFISVVAARSPVTMTVAFAPSERVGMPNQPPPAGQEVQAIVTLKTGSGKPIAPEDLLVTHTRPLHLLILDATLTDYQHVHPQPGPKAGEWHFSFRPVQGGAYRVFADFTPAATARGLYASADLEVGPVKGSTHALPASGAVVERNGFRFSLAAGPQPLRAGQPLDLAFSIARPDGGPVPLQPVMGAFAHLVAFDGERSGFAHLHPAEADLLKPPHATKPLLNFKLTIPQPGKYVIWAQVNLGGREEFVPFAVEVI